MSSIDILGDSWHISPQGLNIITNNNAIQSKTEILKNALNTDLKEIGNPILTKLSTKNSISEVVLQIQKIRNISAPKANENSQTLPRLLKLTLTDGDTYIQAIETSPIPTINRDRTPPGTKLRIKSAKIVSGYILLNEQNCTVLGGTVPALYEKWQLAISIQQHNRLQSSNNGPDGPPAWVNFGSKITGNQPPSSSFKSLTDATATTKDNTGFDLQRQDAIAEAAASGARRKVFGGGIKQRQSANIQAGGGGATTTSTYSNRRGGETAAFNRGGDRNRNRGNNRRNNNNMMSSNHNEDGDEMPQKPSERVSLFDFLENKLPVNEPPPPARRAPFVYSYTQPPIAAVSAQTNNSKYTNNSNYYNNYKQQTTTTSSSNNRNYKDNFNNSTYHNNNKFYQKNENGYPNSNKDRPAATTQNNASSIKTAAPTQSNRSSMKAAPAQNNVSSSNTKAAPAQNNASSNNSTKTQAQNNPSSSSTAKSGAASNIIKSAENSVVNDLSNNLDKMSINNNNSQFASRTLRQHLNLNTAPGTVKKAPISGDNEKHQIVDRNWKVGDNCLAKYWEDGKIYNASIVAVTEKTCVIKFKGYGNIEEVLKTDCSMLPNNNKFETNSKKTYPGSMEFRRSGNKQ